MVVGHSSDSGKIFPPFLIAAFISEVGPAAGGKLQGDMELVATPGEDHLGEPQSCWGGRR